jgi:hypothetical protein
MHNAHRNTAGAGLEPWVAFGFMLLTKQAHVYQPNEQGASLVPKKVKYPFWMSEINNLELHLVCLYYV